MIPGNNLLAAALGIIGNQVVMWQPAVGRTQNALGQWVTAYAAPVPVRGSFQPMDKAKYQELGLDLSRSYWTLYTPHPIDGINRGESPDRLLFNGRRYTVENETDWYNIDGWRALLCVDIGEME